MSEFEKIQVDKVDVEDALSSLGAIEHILSHPGVIPNQPETINILNFRLHRLRSCLEHMLNDK